MFLGTKGDEWELAKTQAPPNRCHEWMKQPEQEVCFPARAEVLSGMTTTGGGRSPTNRIEHIPIHREMKPV